MLAALAAVALAGGAAPRSGDGGPPAAAAPRAGDGAPQVSAGAGALQVVIETIVVDRRGTWSAGADEASIFPGTTGVLEKSVTLIGRRGASPARETVRLTTRVAPGRTPEGECALRISITPRPALEGSAGPGPPAGAHDRSVSITLKPEERRLVEAYASAVTEGRLALEVRCGAPPGPDAGVTPRLIEIDLALERVADEGRVETLRHDRLNAALGREASRRFTFTVPLDGPGPAPEEGPARYRSDSLEILLFPRLVSAGRLQLEITLRGELVTMSRLGAEARHPIERVETMVLPPGRPHTIEVEARAGDTAAEGWSRALYRVSVTGRF